jgi:putative membrane protein
MPHINHGSVIMKQQFTHVALFAAAISLGSATGFAQQGGGTTRGSSPGQATQGATEPRQPTQSGGGSQSSNAIASADQTFLKNAAIGGLMEVELGRLATEKAASADVKQFGQRMVDDHGKANEQLATLAKQKNVDVATQLTGKAKADYDRLSKLSGEPFDRAYMQMMVQDHRKDVSEFRKESTAAKDADVKSFASQTLPTLEDHFKMAQQAQSSLRGARATSGRSTGATAPPAGTGGTQPKDTSGAPQTPQK